MQSLIEGADRQEAYDEEDGKDIYDMRCNLE